MQAALLLDHAIATGDGEALDSCVDQLESLTRSAALQGRDRVIALDRLCGALLYRVLRTGQRQDLDRAVEVGSALVATAGIQDDPGWAGYVSNLGLGLQIRFERTGSVEDMNRAVGAAEAAVAATPEDDPDWIGYLGNLGLAVRARYELLGRLDDLDRAIEVADAALADDSRDLGNRGTWLINQSTALRARHERLGMPEDLDRAVDLGEAALAALPSDDPERAGYLNRLAGVLWTRFLRSGELRDLDRAVQLGEAAVAATPIHDAAYASRLSTLSVALRLRFERTDASEDLDAAVEAVAAAAATITIDHPDRGKVLSNLGLTLRVRFERSGATDDLDGSVDAGEAAVAATPADSPDRAGMLSNLGAALQARFVAAGDMDDLDRAIVFGQAAIDATPEGDPARTHRLSNLCGSLVTRFKRTGVREDLDRAVASGKDAVAAAPVDHPNRAAFLLNLGVALDNRWRLSADADDADTQMAALREAARLKPAPVSRRIQAARLWGRGAVERANFQDAVEGFSEAVELLGLLVHRRLGRHDQQSLLAGLQGLGQEAAAACLAAGRPDTGVELFEQSRAVLFAQALATRTDLTELQQDHPDLASRFVWCCDELARGEAEGIGMTPGSVREPDGSVRDAVEHRRVVVAELDAVLETIRSLPRYRRFLLPRPVAELLSASSEGPVVLINVTGLRSDALVLRSDGVAVVPLPAVGPDVVRDRAAAFFTSLEDALNPYQPETARADAEAGLDDVLTWLWDEVVGPVLHHARLEVPADDDAAWTRVWWCPSGPLALLPLHAAGRHHTGMFYSPEAALDRVVSSTTPTVGALIHARRRRRVPAGGRVLVVAMPRTPGHPDLPGAEDEAEIISRRLPGRVDLMGPTGTTEATLANVTAELPRHSWVHFACHSVSDIANPDASHLALQDYQTRPLTVLELMRARLEEAELAFLSACTTARGNANLPDEPIHLAAACQLAGFRHVVATLWPIRDRDAVHLAGAFYAELLKRSSSEEADAAAVALHHATRLLRQVHPEAPSRWATYTHTGG